ncbi:MULTISPECIES: hypothetical protein [unclassified Halomonas]|nr:MULTISPECIES: hypothetical protein [unclassified Halomonas]
MSPYTTLGKEPWSAGSRHGLDGVAGISVHVIQLPSLKLPE